MYNIYTTPAQRLRHCINVIQMFCVRWVYAVILINYTVDRTINDADDFGESRWCDFDESVRKLTIHKYQANYSKPPTKSRIIVSICLPF